VGKKTEDQEEGQEKQQKEWQEMTTGNGPQLRWQVHLSEVVAQSLYDLQYRAAAEGRGQAALAALRSIIDRLKTDPTEFGEPLYRLPGMKLELRTAAVGPIVMDFAVSAERRLVFIKGVTLMSM
jgi:hypothetical protein